MSATRLKVYICLGNQLRRLFHFERALFLKPISSYYTSVRCQVTKPKQEPQSSYELEEITKQKKFSELTTGQKVKRVGYDATYAGIIIVGLGVTGSLFYIVGRELFSGKSPNGVYTKALKEVRKHEEVASLLGTPIKGYGETTRRGRRRFTSHHQYEIEGIKRMRMKFYAHGSISKGTVHLEVQEDEKGKFQYRYLFVEIEEFPHRTIVIYDYR